MSMSDQTAEQTPKNKKILNILLNVFTVVIFIFAIIMVIFSFMSAKNPTKEGKSILGVKMFIVQSDSMKEGYFAAGDLIFVGPIKNPSKLQEGDVITFRSTNTVSFNEIVTHKIRSIVRDKNGEAIVFHTYGTTTGADDQDEVGANNLIGKYMFHIPKAGKVVAYLKTPIGYVTCILLPCLLIILVQVIHIALTSRRNTNAEVQQEKAQAQKELQEALALKNELEELKKKMMEIEGSKSDTPPTES